MEETRLIAGFQLPSQVRYEDLDGVRRGEGIVTPDLLEEPLARHDDALVAHEVLEQLELALRELDRALRAAHLVGVGVELQVADDERGAAARRASAQQRAQAREQLLALEGLDEVVVGAGVGAAARAVSMRIGTSPPSLRSARATSMPSIFGRPRSRTTRSGLNSRASVRAASPSWLARAS
jgi:hypothetical protein